MNWLVIDEQIRRWLQEDMPYGDITTDSLIGTEAVSSGEFIAKASGIVAGIDVVKRVFSILDTRIVLDFCKKDGDSVDRGEIISRIQGNTRNILKGERLALNLFQHMSGIATQTSRYATLIRGTKARIVDTRKTMPGLRMLEKYAVCVGGGYNHRYGLSDAVMIKDNHIKACGGIREAILLAKNKIPHTMKIEVEVETLEQMEEALKYGADIVMLDNMDISTMKQAVAINNGRAHIEASGNIDLESVRAVAQTGVDIISSGALTHSVIALDISLKLY